MSECLQLLAEALPYVEAGTRWDEDSTEYANERRIAQATDLAARIQALIDQSGEMRSGRNE